ncbi:MAG: type IV pilus assembly protein PilM [Candidatus Omnitrophica bacterium]|nr:type IV pilus assembly protein PilM [Candidatus Omnitrophota bacterium]
MFHSKTKNRSIGLDIGSFSLKLVEIDKKNTGFELLNCSLSTIDPSTEPLKIPLKKFHSDSSATIDMIKTAVSGKEIVTRYEEFPLMSKSALIHSLKFDYEKYIPYPLKEAVIDIEILNKTPQGKMNVLIVSAPKNNIQEKIELLKRNSLKPYAITLDCMALYNAFSFSPFILANRSFVLINIGSSYTNVVIIKNGNLIFSRDINIAGNDFTQTIADKNNISLDAAEKTKINWSDPSLSETLSIDFNSLISEIELSIAFSKKNHDLSDLESIYLSGGSSRLTALLVSIAEALSLKTELWNPFIKLKKNKKFDLLEQYYPELIIALGIALS